MPTSRVLQRWLRQRFSLLTDKAENEEIDRRIRDGVALQGATPWVLMCAIFIASIGLNVNSTAVIIGAMLVSPLMGPIMGIGHGVAIYDFDLLKRAFLNLWVSSMIGLLVSTGYFLLTPLSEAQSELLARTSPTLWDVLIAFFGGLAGIVGLSRQEKSNVLPGVAIATALMPPLCTAGYGLATHQWSYFVGAFYLFSINCVFIALATVLGVRLLRFPVHRFVDNRMERAVRMALMAVALCTALPSAYLAFRLVQAEMFKAKALRFVQQALKGHGARAVDTQVDASQKRIDVVAVGDTLSQGQVAAMQASLPLAGLGGATLAVHQVHRDKTVDTSAIKAAVLRDLYRDSQDTLRQQEEALATLKTEQAAREALLGKSEDMFQELKAQWPAAKGMLLTQGIAMSAEGKKPVVCWRIQSRVPVGERDRQRLLAWAKARLKTEDVALDVERVK